MLLHPAILGILKGVTHLTKIFGSHTIVIPAGQAVDKC